MDDQGGKELSLSEQDVEKELDKLSLGQALTDLEVALLRVTDLTQRLIESSEENRGLKAQLQEMQELRVAHEALKKQHTELVSTKAFKLMQVIWTIRKTLNV